MGCIFCCFWLVILTPVDSKVFAVQAIHGPKPVDNPPAAPSHAGGGLSTEPQRGLRHSIASLLTGVARADLRTAADILGHWSIQTTTRYAHLYDAARHEAMMKTGSIYTRQKNKASHIARPDGVTA